MKPQAAPEIVTMSLYDDVEAAILEQEAADPDWHFGFSAAALARHAHETPAQMARFLSTGTLAEAQGFAGLMLRRWLRTQDDRRAQFWRDVASTLARRAGGACPPSAVIVPLAQHRALARAAQPVGG